MAMGTRKQREKQEDIWIAHAELASAPGHPFYQRLNELLEAEGFDEFVEGRCGKFYAAKYGRPSLTPGIYFRSLLVGYFEGIDSERGIAWRLADSLALRRFVGIALDEKTPDHSTISRTRRLIDLETHREVFAWALRMLADHGLLKGKRIAIDATTLEANAAMRSIVRRDTGESYEEFLVGLAKASGITTPTREELARLDRKRKKRMSNKEWRSPSDGDARIAKMKDGRTHLAHKAEHAVDLDTGAVVAVTLQGADEGDTTTLDKTLSEAGMAVAELVGREAEQRPDEPPKVNLNGIEEVVADKGYHSGAVVQRVKSYQVRSYIPEKKQTGRRCWQGKAEEQEAVYQNRRRVRGEYGKSLRRRGELVERSFAHCYDTGGMRRTHLRGHQNILKRQLIHVGAFNLSLILRQLLGAGTPREWRNRCGLLLLLLDLLATRWQRQNRPCRSEFQAAVRQNSQCGRAEHAAGRAAVQLVTPRAVTPEHKQGYSENDQQMHRLKNFHPRPSAKSIRLMHACLRVHLNQAKVWEMVTKNPAIGVKLPRRKQRKPTILLPLAMIGQLIELLPEPTKSVVVLIVFGSLRIGEVLALR